MSGTTRLTHGELHTAVTVAGRRLEGLGVRAGDRVVVQLPNCAQFVVLVLALLDIGAPPVLVLPGFGDYELGHVVRAARPVALAVSAGNRSSGPVASARRLREDHETLDHVLALGDVAAGDVDLAALCDPGAPWDAPVGPAPPRTPAPGARVRPHRRRRVPAVGGHHRPAEGDPRGNAGYAYMIRTACGIADVSPDAVYLAVMPAAHGFVLNCPGVLGTLAQGGTVVLGDTTDPRQALGLIERERVTHCALVPTVAMQWLAAAEGTTADLSSLRVLQTGGARPCSGAGGPDPPRAGGDAPAVLRHERGAAQLHGARRPRVGDRRDPGPPRLPHGRGAHRGRAGPSGGGRHDGELLTRGPYTVAGYYRDPAATAKAFTQDGFYRTGDLATRTPGGDLVVNGRVRDIINRGGEKIPAEDLELLVARHPDVRASAAVGAPHELYGEVVCLYVVPEAGREPTLLELRRFLRGLGLAVWKLPELMETVAQLPTTAIGKIDKKALRADIARRTAVEA